MTLTNSCPQCKRGVLVDLAYAQEFFPLGKPVSVELLQSKCNTCGHTRTLSSQHNENLRRLAARKAHYGGQLMGEEYRALRRRYGLTQSQMASLFGLDAADYIRYEDEEAYPNNATRLLVEVALTRPDVVKALADKAGIPLPLLQTP